MDGSKLARTAHFMLYHLPLTSLRSLPAASGSGSATQPHADQTVFCAAAPASVWLGALVPKRWARKAVTRNTLRRQIHAVAALYASRWPASALVVRLCAAFDRSSYVSASSDALKAAARRELVQLFEHASRAGTRPHA